MCKLVGLEQRPENVKLEVGMLMDEHLQHYQPFEAHWSLYVPHSGHYMYRTVVIICTASLTFTNSTFCPHSCIYVFCVDLRTNSDYFPIQH